jgi:hypothetical protein
MIARFRIGLATAPTPDLVHQLRNYGEYVHGIVADKAQVDMQQVDAATVFSLVEVSDKRNLGAVTAALRKGTRPAVTDSHFTLERL